MEIKKFPNAKSLGEYQEQLKSAVVPPQVPNLVELQTKLKEIRPEPFTPGKDLPPPPNPAELGKALGAERDRLMSELKDISTSFRLEVKVPEDALGIKLP